MCTGGRGFILVNQVSSLEGLPPPIPIFYGRHPQYGLFRSPSPNLRPVVQNSTWAGSVLPTHTHSRFLAQRTQLYGPSTCNEPRKYNFPYGQVFQTPTISPKTLFFHHKSRSISPKSKKKGRPTSPRTPSRKRGQDGLHDSQANKIAKQNEVNLSVSQNVKMNEGSKNQKKFKNGSGKNS